MSLGWIQSEAHAPDISFQACLRDWPSSTRVEAMAIEVTIYNSQCCMDTFKRCFAPLTTPRRFEKFNNKAIWYAIRQLIFSG